MSSFNFSPILTNVGFYTDINTVPKNQITQLINVRDLKRILIYFTMIGAKYTASPIDWNQNKKFDFYINVALINYRGGKEPVIYNNYSHHVSEETVFPNEEMFGLLIDLVDEKMINDPNFNFDLTSTYLQCVIFHSEREITNQNELQAYLFEPYYVLYSSKLPIIGGKRYD